jgi:hypothetical protein
MARRREVKRKRGRPRIKPLPLKNPVLTRINGCQKVLNSEEINTLMKIKTSQLKQVNAKIKMLEEMLENDEIPEVYKLGLEERVQVLEEISAVLEKSIVSFQELAVKIKAGELPISQLYFPNPLLTAIR